MIIVSIWVEAGCEFSKKEYRITVDGVIQDTFNLDIDPGLIDDCITEYDGEIKQEVLYTFFLNRANIATAYPGYEVALDIWKVVENLHKIDIQL